MALLLMASASQAFGQPAPEEDGGGAVEASDYIVLAKSRAEATTRGPDGRPLNRADRAKAFKVGNGIWHSVGFAGGNLRPFIEGNAEAVRHLNAYRARRAAQVGGFVAAGLGIGLAVAGAEKGGERYNPQTQQTESLYRFSAVGVAGLAMVGVGTLVGIFSGKGARKHVVRAVDAYNDDVQQHRSRARLHVVPSVRPGGVGARILLGL